MQFVLCVNFNQVQNLFFSHQDSPYLFSSQVRRDTAIRFVGVFWPLNVQVLFLILPRSALPLSGTSAPRKGHHVRRRYLEAGNGTKPRFHPDIRECKDSRARSSSSTCAQTAAPGSSQVDPLLSFTIEVIRTLCQSLVACRVQSLVASELH